MEAADRASSLFSEVRSVCQRTASPDALTAETLSPDTPSAILSLSRAYQRMLPGTLQTVQKLADEAGACGLPKGLLSIGNKNVKDVEDSTCDDYNFEKSQDCGVCIYLLVSDIVHHLLLFSVKTFRYCIARLYFLTYN